MTIQELNAKKYPCGLIDVNYPDACIEIYKSIINHGEMPDPTKYQYKFDENQQLYCFYYEDSSIKAGRCVSFKNPSEKLYFKLRHGADEMMVSKNGEEIVFHSNTTIVSQETFEALLQSRMVAPISSQRKEYRTFGEAAKAELNQVNPPTV